MARTTAASHRANLDALQAWDHRNQLLVRRMRDQEQRRHERLQRVARHLQRTASYQKIHGLRVIDPDSWQALAVIYHALYLEGART